MGATAEGATAEGATAEAAMAELFNLGWTLRRSHQILTLPWTLRRVGVRVRVLRVRVRLGLEFGFRRRPVAAMVICEYLVALP